MTTKKEETLAQCYLRYSKGKANPRYHAFLNQSKVYLKKNTDEYEMYSIKDMIGIHFIRSYRWIFLIIGILLMLIGLYFYNFGLFSFMVDAPTDELVPLEEISTETFENWTYGSFGIGMVFFLLGLTKRSYLVIKMINRDLNFRVYQTTDEFLNFVHNLENRIGRAPKQ